MDKWDARFMKLAADNRLVGQLLSAQPQNRRGDRKKQTDHDHGL